MTTKDTTGQLFTPEQPDLLDASYEEQVAKRKAQPVDCLGQTFPSDQARREHFLGLLREKLKDPEFRRQPGFPVGADEDILRLSDPPYYTACPNPFLADFVRLYGSGYNAATDSHRREPFAVDVTVGKTDSLYKAHGYHTKVPHLAIVPSILHYTEPGDIILDGFSGSGMTGVAAQWCGSAPADYRRQIEAAWADEGRNKPKWGARRAILNDLSPAAAFISANYNLPFDGETFTKAAQKLLRKAEEKVGWMYETTHTDGSTVGRINFTVWSEIFHCPECAGEVVFLEEALDDDSKSVRKTFPCPHCTKELTRRSLERASETFFDHSTGKTVSRPKKRPVQINYSVGKNNFNKVPDKADIDRIERISNLPLPPGFPTDRMMHAAEDVECWGDEWRSGVAAFSHVHHFFLPRPAQALGYLWGLVNEEHDYSTFRSLMFFVEQAIWGMSLLNRYTPTHFSHVNQYMSGRIRAFSQHAECSPWYVLGGKLKRLAAAFGSFQRTRGNCLAMAGDCGSLGLHDESIDYIFTDPPFGHNFAYSELNFLVESFHKAFTTQTAEAIVSKTQKKGVVEYNRLMRRCFTEYYRVLKPGRWMTVVFSNTQAAIWNGIQTALQESGFVIANVSALDKMQGSFNSVMNATSVKQDLVISAYKPNGGLGERFEKAQGAPESVWDFVRTHLSYLPVAKVRAGTLEFIRERDPRIIFDRMVAWFVKHDFQVPLSSQEFQAGLANKFEFRDGMYFLVEQVVEYDKKKMQTASVPQAELFVFDERSAIDWLTDFLKRRPSTYAEAMPDYMKALLGWVKHEKPVELSEILEQNFLRYDGTGDVPSQIHAYLSSNYKDYRNKDKDDVELRDKAKDRWFVPDPNKLQDLEAKREKQLLREFDELLTSKEKRIKQPRHEVIRAGFKRAWGQKDYATIKAIAAKIPDEVIQEDQQLLMWYDMALTRLGDDVF